MLSEQDLILIEKYARGELDASALSEFEHRLRNDLVLRQRTFAEKLVQLSLSPHPIVKSQRIVAALGDDLFADEDYGQADVQEKAQEYTLEELLDMFRPLAHIEAEVLHRSGVSLPPESLQNCVVLPENGINCLESKLYFAFNPTPNVPVIVSVMDNRENEMPLANILIPAGVESYQVALPRNLKPGKYYWKLRPDTDDRQLRRRYGVAVGSFFIGAELMPK